MALYADNNSHCAKIPSIFGEPLIEKKYNEGEQGEKEEYDLGARLVCAKLHKAIKQS